MMRSVGEATRILLIAFCLGSRETTVSRRALLIIRLCVFTAACAFLFFKVIGNDLLSNDWLRWQGADRPIPWPMLAVVMALMPVNWSLEALKWRRLVVPIERIGVAKALAATIAGTSVALVTPNRTGEFVGRVLFLRPENRWSAGFVGVLGSMAQFIVTLVVGCVAVAFGVFNPDASSGIGYAHKALVWMAVLIAAAGLWLYFRPDVLKRLLQALPFLDRFADRMAPLERADGGVLRIILALSLLRYAVFAAQFILLVHAFAGTAPFEAALGVPAVFLFTTLLPTTLLSEVAVRGSVAAAVLPGAPMDLVIATTMLWLVNLVIPAIVGSIILLFARIRTNEDRK